MKIKHRIRAAVAYLAGAVGGSLAGATLIQIALLSRVIIW